ncbi:uncharacterized protein [Ptychodera flava]|uniref:uncharacterized protein n=1 Tax=Ptychodera flava TaxID=63121 RepID=UPI00396A6477
MQIKALHIVKYLKDSTTCHVLVLTCPSVTHLYETTPKVRPLRIFRSHRCRAGKSLPEEKMSPSQLVFVCLLLFLYSVVSADGDTYDKICQTDPYRRIMESCFTNEENQMCGMLADHNQKTNFTHWSCNCDEDCMKYGDCCHDYQQACLGQSDHKPAGSNSGSAIEKDTDMESCEKFSDGHQFGIWMISKCPESYEDDVTRKKCEGSNNFGFAGVNIPVTAGLKVYRNVYCSICNGLTPSDMVPWEVEVFFEATADEWNSLMRHLPNSSEPVSDFMMQTRQNSSSTYHVVPKFTTARDKTGAKLRVCGKDVIERCDDSLEIKFPFVQIDNASCLSDFSAVHDFISGDTYRNSHCYLCNLKGALSRRITIDCGLDLQFDSEIIIAEYCTMSIEVRFDGIVTMTRNIDGFESDSFTQNFQCSQVEIFDLDTQTCMSVSIDNNQKSLNDTRLVKSNADYNRCEIFLVHLLFLVSLMVN